MDYTRSVQLTSSYLGSEITVEFPSVLDPKMSDGIRELNVKRVNTSGGKVQINSYALRVRFFNNHAVTCLKGITIPKTAKGDEWKTYVPDAVKEDMVSQIEGATTVGPAEVSD